MKKLIGLVMTAVLLATFLSGTASAVEFTAETDAKSLILMDAATGTILYEFNADEKLPPASVTKIMTILLVVEAIDSGKIQKTDMVTVSAHASSMGGSQVYLKEGETMSVDDMLKAVVVASANDAAVALAEYVCGSESAFVSRMNERAAELGMTNTVFMNTNGLDDTVEGHLTTARDIALMSRELLTHEMIFDYTTIWMDTIRDGAFGLTNTNRLVRFYNGANGLKTGSTSKAKFCISATAKRDNMQLIAVVMAASTRDTRNQTAAALLDFGFANFALKEFEAGTLDDLYVKGGVRDSCSVKYDAFRIIVEKGKENSVTQNIELPESINAPVAEGDVLGSITYTCDGEEIGKTELRAGESVEKIGFFSLFYRMLCEAIF